MNFAGACLVLDASLPQVKLLEINCGGFLKFLVFTKPKIIENK